MIIRPCTFATVTFYLRRGKVAFSFDWCAGRRGTCIQCAGTNQGNTVHLQPTLHTESIAINNLQAKSLFVRFILHIMMLITLLGYALIVAVEPQKNLCKGTSVLQINLLLDLVL